MFEEEVAAPAVVPQPLIRKTTWSAAARTGCRALAVL